MISPLIGWVASHLLTTALASLVPGAGLVTLLVRNGAGLLRWIETHRQDAVMIALVIACAALYGWGATGQARRAAERDRLAHWIDTACAAAGTTYQTAEPKAGVACMARIADLARYERDTSTESARILADAAREREAKAARDAEQARATAADTRATAEAMEKANGKVGSDDRVGGDWFAALNRVGGLRAPAR
jgi:hypothetical protein